jgi:hypothetical protein
MKQLQILFFSIFVFHGILFSADVSLQATVDRNQVALNERFLYTVAVSGESTSLPKPNFPALDGFSILSGPNTSTNIQFVNGAMSSSNSYSFHLMPQKVGTFKIAPATIEVNGEIISSNHIEVKVVKSTVDKDKKNQSIQNVKDKNVLGENLFLKTIVNKKSVFQNEQLLVKYNLYFRLSVRSYNVEKIPANPGFWMEEFKLPSQPPIGKEIINGVTYQVATLRKVALFPTRSGELTIEPMVISVDALVKKTRRSRSIFDNFFDDPFGKTVKKTLNSNPVSITVKSLPNLNRPSDFQGVVGNYRMSINPDKTELKANEAVSIKLSIAGEGNLKLLTPPKLKLPPDMEVYDPKEKTSITREKDRVGGSKMIEYVVVPRFKGKYKIDPVSLSYFDPRKSKYFRLITDPILLNILAGDVSASGLMAGSNLSKQDITLLGEDIRFVKESAEYYMVGERLYRNWFYLLSYLIPLLCLALAWQYSVYRNKMRGDVRLARRRKAGKIAAKHLSKARQTLKQNDRGEFYRATTQALQGFVCDRLNIQISDFSSVDVEKDLEKAGLGGDEINEYLTCLQESDFQRYSGSDADAGQLKLFFERVRKILTRMEKYI